MSPRTPADARLQRLLALVPWVAAQDGPTLAEVCARFGCSESELLGELQLLFLCGLYPYTPDVLIEVDIADGRVWIRYADYFSRPLRLTPGEGVALLAAGRTLLAAPGADPDGPLGRGLAKLASALGVEGEAGIDISLGTAADEVMNVLKPAIDSHRQVMLDYYAFGRDEWTQRTVDPYVIFSAAGQWYLSAFCHRVDDERLFRVDRIRTATLLSSTFDPPATSPELATFAARPEDPRVVLDLDPSARWVVEQYPVEHVESSEGGGVRVTLAVSERAWLERLLLRLGPSARVIEGDSSIGPTAARRLRQRYGPVDDDPSTGSTGGTVASHQS